MLPETDSWLSMAREGLKVEVNWPYSQKPETFPWTGILEKPSYGADRGLSGRNA